MLPKSSPDQAENARMVADGHIDTGKADAKAGKLLPSASQCCHILTTEGKDIHAEVHTSCPYTPEPRSSASGLLWSGRTLPAHRGLTHGSLCTQQLLSAMQLPMLTFARLNMPMAAVNQAG